MAYEKYPVCSYVDAPGGWGRVVEVLSDGRRRVELQRKRGLPGYRGSVYTVAELDVSSAAAEWSGSEYDERF